MSTELNGNQYDLDAFKERNQRGFRRVDPIMGTPVIGLARWRVFLAFGVDVVCQFVRWTQMVGEDNLNQSIGKDAGRPRRRVRACPMGENGDRLGLNKALEKRPMTSKEWRRKSTWPNVTHVNDYCIKRLPAISTMILSVARSP